MDRQRMEEIIARVVAECQKAESGAWMEQTPFSVPVEVSARHVHLTKEAITALFGAGKKLTPKKNLSQPGQFLSEERLTLVTSKGVLEQVAVLGPERSAVQVELSATDCRNLGIKAPVCLSGDLSDAGDVYLLGPNGFFEARGSVIIARSHVHMRPEEAEKAGIKDGDKVRVTLGQERKLTLEDVICRVSDTAALAMHIDFDEANACMLPKNAEAFLEKIRQKDEKCSHSASMGHVSQERDREDGEMLWDGGLITESQARGVAGRKGTCLCLKSGTIVTPSAQDVLRHAGIEVVFRSGR